MDNQPGIRGTFNSSLRSDSIWEVLGPILLASSKSIEGQATILAVLTHHLGDWVSRGISTAGQ
jgi:hypothetical protein